MKTTELEQYLNENGITAEELLDKINPNLKKRFERNCKQLSKIIDEIRQYYPDTIIFIEEDCPSLTLGDPHDKNGMPRKKLIVASSLDLISKIDCGMW